MDALARRCTALNRQGLPCGRAPIPGGFVCVMHGGRAPQVQKTAKERLDALALPVIGTFGEILANWHSTRCTGCGHVDENGVKCVGCGKPTGDPAPVIRIGQLVLDRTGFHPTMTVEQVAPPSDVANLTDDEMIAKLERMLASARAIRDRKQRLLGAGPVDAIVVDEGYLVPEDEEATPPAAPAQQADDPVPDGNGTPDKRTED